RADRAAPGLGRGQRLPAARQPHRARREQAARVHGDRVRRGGRPPRRRRPGHGRDPSAAVLLQGAPVDARGHRHRARARLGRRGAVAGPHTVAARGTPGLMGSELLRARLRLAIDIAAVVAALALIATYSPASVMFSNTTTNGGDMGTHYSPAWYLRYILLP